MSHIPNDLKFNSGLTLLLDVEGSLTAPPTEGVGFGVSFTTVMSAKNIGRARYSEIVQHVIGRG